MADNVSKSMKKYMDELLKKTNEALKIAAIVRKKGFDPSKEVEINIAKGLTERVVGLISIVAPQLSKEALIKRIKELEQEYEPLDWRVAMKIAEEVAKEKFGKFSSQKEAIEIGVRVGFSYITMGVVSSPLEGFLGIDLVDRLDGKGKYFRVNYAGPVRSAGGTAAAVSVLIVDYLRKVFGFMPYDPTEQEVKRAYIEIEDYHSRVTNLQYFPSKEEIIFLASHLPVQISGDPTEKIEVSNYKDLPRVPTNKVRNGFCLVMAECLALKAPKLLKNIKKWGKEMGMEHWNFLETFVDIQKKKRAKEEKETKGLTPDYAYIKDLVAGRPVLSHPLRYGGLRIRLGRSRASGYSGQAVHPATMYILKGYIAIGTQLKVERPGKSTTLTPCDTIDGPIVKLEDGSVIYLNSVAKAREVAKQISEILYLGDVLISYGDFFNRNHPLVPLGYCEEWWIQEVEKATINLFGNLDLNELSDLLGIEVNKLKSLFDNPLKNIPSFELAIKISKALNVPLHPKYIFYWTAIDKEQLINLLRSLKFADIRENKIIIPLNDLTSSAKRALELIGLPHVVASSEFIVVEPPYSNALFSNLGIIDDDSNIDKIGKEQILNTIEKNIEKINSLEKDTLSCINILSSIKIRDKAGTFLGARMGRPEKAKIRKMTGSPNGLIPVGEQGGRMRSLNQALEKDEITEEFAIRFCPKCKKEVLLMRCEYCGRETEQKYYCKYCGIVDSSNACPHNPKPYREKKIKPSIIIDPILASINETMPPLVKGVRKTSNKWRIFEHPAKAILRAKHSLTVNKDGTIRYDATELAITHFKPKEIGTSIEKLKELGYTHDIYGNPLEHEDQILELKPQDIILPASPASPEEPADEIFFRIANFIDDLLVKLYKEKPFYDLYSKKDLIGHLAVVLAPHTSAGVVTRIIGFSKTQGLLAHPMVHAGIRRDVDGDEAAVMLLLDTLINFSRFFLPASRGSTQDTPLVLTTILDPEEVDDMFFDVDIDKRYPLELYEASQRYAHPAEINIKRVAHVLGTKYQYEGFQFTHDTTDINQGVLCSAYKLLPSMEEKIAGQMELARKIRAVDEREVAKLVIDKHLLRDVKGNLRKFSNQEFRCVNCNTKYRRPPLHGKCEKCKGRIIFTVSEGTVTKYLNYILKLAEEYNVDSYMKESIYILKRRIEEVFGREKEEQTALKAFF